MRTEAVAEVDEQPLAARPMVCQVEGRSHRFPVARSAEVVEPDRGVIDDLLAVRAFTSDVIHGTRCRYLPSDHFSADRTLAKAWPRIVDRSLAEPTGRHSPAHA